MSSTYAGSNIYPTSITEPSDGDAVTAASVNAAIEGLADRSTYLKNRVALYTFATGPLAKVAGSRTWPTTTSFDQSLASGIRGSGSDTPFTGLLAGDVLLCTYVLGVSISSGTNAFEIKLVSSESATDYVSGVWSDISGTDRIAQSGLTNGQQWFAMSWRYVMAADGHVRFAAIARDVNSAGGAANDTPAGAGGFYQILRAG